MIHNVFMMQQVNWKKRVISIEITVTLLWKDEVGHRTVDKCSRVEQGWLITCSRDGW